jgi:hypothetical protein
MTKDGPYTIVFIGEVDGTVAVGTYNTRFEVTSGTDPTP